MLNRTSSPMSSMPGQAISTGPWPRTYAPPLPVTCSTSEWRMTSRFNMSQLRRLDFSLVQTVRVSPFSM